MKLRSEVWVKRQRRWLTPSDVINRPFNEIYFCVLSMSQKVNIDIFLHKSSLLLHFVFIYNLVKCLSSSYPEQENQHELLDTKIRAVDGLPPQKIMAICTYQQFVYHIEPCSSVLFRGIFIPFRITVQNTIKPYRMIITDHQVRYVSDGQWLFQAIWIQYWPAV